ncbi:MAG: hypothetical protein AB2A00_21010 [Myxococcota bacterium]
MTTDPGRCCAPPVCIVVGMGACTALQGERCASVEDQWRSQVHLQAVSWLGFAGDAPPARAR